MAMALRTGTSAAPMLILGLLLAISGAAYGQECPGASVILCAYGPPGDDFGKHGNATLYMDGETRQLEAALVEKRERGVLVQAIHEGNRVCKPGMILPLFMAEESWSVGLRCFLYLIALLWSFVGIAIIADIFMAAIEVITSTTKTVSYSDPKTGRPATMDVLVWNETIANLTLMALGSSAPEILLAVIETVGSLGEPPSGGLGPSTIVGSAAFNLLMILAVCVVAVPNGETRRVKELGVFTITSISSVFAYVWLLFVLQWHTEGVVDLWEALLTLAFFPLLVTVSYAADRNWCRATKGTTQEVTRHSTEAWVTGTGGMGAHHYGSKSSIGDVVVPMSSVGEDGSDHHFIHHGPRQSRATYRMHGIRMLTGGARVIVPRERLLNLEERVKHDAAVQLNRRPSKTTSQSSRMLPPATSRITFAAPTYGVVEHAGRVVLTVRRAGAIDQPVAVSFETSNGTAMAGEDYESTSGVLAFAPHQREATIAIPITDDDKMEPDENFFCTIREVPPRLAPPGAPKVVFGSFPVAEIIIIDDDKVGTFEFEDAVYSVAENCGEVEVTIVRHNGSDGRVAVNYQTRDGTAIATKDYVAAKGTVVFATGELRKVIPIRIIDDNRYEKEEAFQVEFRFVDEACGAEYGDIRTTTVNISNDEEYKRLVDKLAAAINLNLDRLAIRTTSWAKQYKDAMSVHSGDIDDDEPAAFDYAMHFIAFFWKVLFAAVPPTSIAGGWLAFVVALIFIGLLTMVVGDVASIFGCTLGLPDSITAITFVALGTSLPDTFASKAAAVNDRHADASVGNVTGSNSVNVFLGLGLPWSIAAIYHTAKGTTYEVAAGTLSFSVLVFCMCAVLCLGTLALRRLPGVAGGELGGPVARKWLTFAAFMGLWLVYIVLSSLKSLDKI